MGAGGGGSAGPVRPHVQSVCTLLLTTTNMSSATHKVLGKQNR